MSVRSIRFLVRARCTAKSGETIEAGAYDGTLTERADVNAAGGRGKPVYTLERPGVFPVDVTGLVDSRAIVAAQAIHGQPQGKKYAVLSRDGPALYIKPTANEILDAISQAMTRRPEARTKLKVVG